jgi:outer membrane receptor protein involved in Fe transport
VKSSERVVLVTLAILAVNPTGLAAQMATIAGTVTDSATNVPLVGVELQLTSTEGESAWTGQTDELGSYYASGLEAGSYTLTATLPGYEVTRILIDLAAGENKRGEVRMGVTYLVIRLDPIVVTVSRTEQRLLEVPVSISVVERRTVEEQTALTTIDYIAPLPGSQVLSGGLMTRRYTSRGPNFGQSANIRTMTDFRYTVLPAIEFNADYLVSTTTEDIERLELVRGPATVLYGPNSTRGALNLITRSPLDYRGTAIALVAGARSTLEGTLRHASAFGDKVGFKISGEYFTGSEWPVPAPESASAAATETGADSDALLLGRIITHDQRIRADGRIEWRPAPGTTAMLAGGLAQASVTDYVTFAGNTVSIDDGRYWYIQGRATRGPLIANVYYNRNDLIDGWFPDIGRPLSEHSSAFWFQLQHGVDPGPRESLSYGLDLGRTIGRSDSTLYGSNEGNANVTELGAYLKSTTRLTPEVEFLAAGRLDYHSILGNAAFSPWLSVVYQPSPPHAIRFSATRSFSTSGSIANFSDFVFADLAPLPYRIRNIGQGREQTFRDQGVDISGIPAPDASQVGSVLATLNLTAGRYEPTRAAEVQDIPGAVRRWINTLEVGYKAVIVHHIRAGVDVYYRETNQIGAQDQILTPNVFFDQVALERYLAQFIPAPEATALAGRIAAIPMGTVTPEQRSQPTDLGLGQRRVSGIDYWGAAFDLTVDITPELAATAAYTWTSEDSIPGELNSQVIFNNPKNRVSLAVDYVSSRTGFNATVQGRFVQSYPAANGPYSARLPAYTLVDAFIGYRIPRTDLTLSLTAYNIFDDAHQELPGAPAIGRLVMGGVRAAF